MMRFKFATLSGSRYLIDTDKMTWERKNVIRHHEQIMGLDTNSGILTHFPEIRIGRSAYLKFGLEADDYIHTTQVQSIELLDE